MQNENRRQNRSGDRGQSRHWEGAGRGGLEARREAHICRYAPALISLGQTRYAADPGRDEPAHIQIAVERVESLDILINNAGVHAFDDLSDRSVLEWHLAVNLFGMYGVTRAFLPALILSGGAVVNNISAEALAPLPLTPAYALSKAAAFNLTQSLRALLAPQGVKVHAVLTGPTDTDMTQGLDLPKASPESVARAILDGVEKEEEDIFPDPMSASMAASWRGSAVKAMERQLASFVQAA